MNGSSYQVIYDIMNPEILRATILNWLAWFIFFLLVWMIALYVGRNQFYKSYILIFGGLLMVAWFVMGVMGFGREITDQYACEKWAQGSDYSTVTGNVKDFTPLLFNGIWREKFSVNGVFFEYMDYQPQCGYKTTYSHGGVIEEGLPVRISYKDGRILVLEVRKK